MFPIKNCLLQKIAFAFFLSIATSGSLFAQNTRYICYDESGNRINRASLSCSVLPNCSEPIAITGQANVCEAGIYTYTVPSVASATYTWVITGGTILSGQNTNKISVKWYTGVGKVEMSMAK